MNATISSATKFTAPVISHVVARPRLWALLSGGVQGPVTLVAAPAGWGKTLLAASWIAQGGGGRAVAWVRLDRDDDRSFWATVAGALAPVAGPEAGAALRRLTAAPVDDLPGAVAAALRLAGRPLVLVLDDLHEVTSPQVHADLVGLIERPPSGLSLLVLTRRDPPWPLSRLRLAGLLSEVHVQDLTFRPDEAEELFAVLGVALDASLVDRLAERTEGWPAALRLLALHLERQPDVEAAVAAFSGDDHSVAGYLVTEVLDQQPPDVVGFLEKISVVDLVRADLADALTGRYDGAARLTELAASHLVVQAADRPGRWYRLHRLIGDILRARRLPRGEHRDLRRRAAEWYQRNDMRVDAFRSAVAGELWPLAATLVGRTLAVPALTGAAPDLEQVLAAVPRPVTAAHPELACGLAAARVVRGVDTGVADLLAAGRGRLDALPARRAARARVLLDLTAGALARFQGDWDAVVARHRSVPVDPVTLTGLDLDRAETVPVLVDDALGMAALLADDLPAAERALRRAASTELVPRPLPQLNATAYLGLLRCRRGELGPASTAALGVVRAAAEAGLEHTPQAAGAYLTMAQVALDRTHHEDADEWLGRVAACPAEVHVRAEAALLLAGRWELAGDRERALSGVRATGVEIDISRLPRAMRERWSLAEASLLAALGDPRQARAALERLTPVSTPASGIATARLLVQLEDVPAAVAIRAGLDPDRHPRGAVDACLLDVALALVSKDDDTALDLLEEALVAAAPWVLRRPFLAEVVDLGPLLARRLERGTVVPGFAVDVLGRLAAGNGVVPTVRSADPLTDRERTVLRYLASTLSNAEIAAELYVSVSTVKSHERALYRKLGVANRREAVDRARSLRLFLSRGGE